MMSNQPTTPFADDGSRFIEDEATVTAALAIDDLLVPAAAMLLAREKGLIANAARLYLVDGKYQRLAMLDCNRPWLWIDWADSVAQAMAPDRYGVTCDMMPWRRWFTVPDRTKAKATDTPKAKPTKPIPHRAPYWWNGNPDTTPVRCLDCRHCPTRVGGRCEATGIYHRGNGYWRRCEAYSERRPTFDARLNPDTQGAIIHRIQERLRQAGHDELAKLARVDDCGEISFWGGIPEDAKSAVLPILRGVMV